MKENGTTLNKKRCLIGVCIILTKQGLNTVKLC